MEEMKKVDEDWKRRAQQEKVIGSPPDAPPAQAGGRREPAREEPGDDPRMPDGLFTSFVAGLATQALMHLGLVQGPEGVAYPPDPPQAQYLIDILQTLQEKTRGNLTREEEKNLSSILHELQTAFVAVAKRAGGRKARDVEQEMGDVQ